MRFVLLWLSRISYPFLARHRCDRYHDYFGNSHGDFESVASRFTGPGSGLRRHAQGHLLMGPGSSSNGVQLVGSLQHLVVLESGMESRRHEKDMSTWKKSCTANRVNCTGQP